MSILFLDAESFCEHDVKKIGAAKYVRHPSTEILIWTYAFDQGPVHLWDVTEDPTGYDHPDFQAALGDPSVAKVAFNSPFDRGLVNHVMQARSPVEQWFCAQVLAYSLSFSGGLDAVLKQIGFPADKQKMKEGKKLILKFCKPAPKNHNADRYDRHNSPEEWGMFREYGIQDTAVLRELWMWLMKHNNMSPEEWRLWHLDQAINERGVPVDTDLCHAAMDMHSKEKASIKSRLKDLTGLENPLSNQQMRAWCEDHKFPMANLQKAYVADCIQYPGMPGEVKDALTLYSNAVQIAPTKWKAFLQKADDDGRIRGAFQFAGASRTRRWAGRGVQLHNLRRGPVDECVAELIAAGDQPLVDFMYGDVMTALASSVRAAITAPAGTKLVVSDLSSIESVILGWLSGCGRINNIFISGKDTYKDFATELFGIPYDQVTKAQRTFAKPPVLGCGYQLGWRGLIEYAKSMGVVLTPAEAKHAVRTFRDNYPEIPKLWRWLVDSVIYVVNTGMPVEGYKLTITLENNFLFIRLPSGRRLAYFQPLIEPKVIKYEDEEGVMREMVKDSLTYMGVNRFTNQWDRISAHGGLLTENIIQAIARDVLAHGMDAGHQRGICIIGHVHDEIMSLGHGTQKELDLLSEVMTIRPPWAPDMWLGASGYISQRYKKD